MPAGMRQSYLLENITYYRYNTTAYITDGAVYTHVGANIHRHTSTTAALRSAPSFLGIVL
jgi:hypothetical protein